MVVPSDPGLFLDGRDGGREWACGTAFFDVCAFTDIFRLPYCRSSSLSSLLSLLLPVPLHHASFLHPLLLPLLNTPSHRDILPTTTLTRTRYTRYRRFIQRGVYSHVHTLISLLRGRLRLSNSSRSRSSARTRSRRSLLRIRFRHHFRCSRVLSLSSTLLLPQYMSLSGMASVY